ncbi:unnamed protein product [Candida verbasci]|uniref:LicD/FKTN/FKRP nucleotidyltransferase domain-containing protein n=1 Tax=Candida verbasci TaxID=1227364 RepID=A0A9W4TT57_9ASCO|nr:unnamed protein product [Candida verbasci]
MLKFTSRRFLFKLLSLSTITYTIYLSICLILQKPTIKQYNQQLNLVINHKFNQWYYNILSSKYDLDLDSKFNKKLEEVKREKLSHDEYNDFWDLREDLKYPMDVNYPGHNSFIKPIIQPFDPRLTLSVYYNYITENYHPDLKLPFHWSDWTDMSILNKFILNPDKENLCSTMFNLTQPEVIKDSMIKPVQLYCKYEPDSLLAYTIFDISGQQTIQNREILGKSYLFRTASSPRKIVMLTNSKSYQFEVETEENNLYNSIINNGMIKNSKYNVLESFKSLTKTIPPNSIKSEMLTDHIINIPEESFSSNHTNIINQIKSSTISTTDQHFIESIEYSSSIESPPKYFEEAKLLRSVGDSWQGEHYDWRFFSGLIHDKNEQNIILHRLLKNYLNFTKSNGIITWIAHGSLLSWYWNGISFPWDGDIDVQMPIQDLYKLSRSFNQSLIIESVSDLTGGFDGMGRYFLDVGSSITHRIKGNGNNAIDARFIDVDTGLYIDITGLALSSEPANSRYDPEYELITGKSMTQHMKSEINHYVKNQALKVYNCRNGHFSSYNELSPLVSTVIENHLGYIPSKFINILNSEYKLGALTKKNHRDFTFFNNFRIWYNTEIVLDYLRQNENWQKHKNGKIVKNTSLRIPSQLELLNLNKLTMDDHLNLIESNGLFYEFEKTKSFTKYHQLELEMFLKNKYQDTEKLIRGYDELGKSLRGDYFMNQIFKDGENSELINYEVRYNKLIELMNEYKSENNNDD